MGFPYVSKTRPVSSPSMPQMGGRTSALLLSIHGGRKDDELTLEVIA